jgi:hypothetical protein
VLCNTQAVNRETLQRFIGALAAKTPQPEVRIALDRFTQ